MDAEYVALARAIHVLALVHWIGGVAIVTTIVLPAALKLPNAIEAVAAFERFERRFAAQVRISIALVGLSGLYMLYAYDAWDRFEYLSFGWLHLMVAVWALFAVMVYILEPLLIHRAFHEFALHDKNRAFTIAIGLHSAVLILSAIAIVAGVLGTHGGL
jgi:uncharacterized membrane protein